MDLRRSPGEPQRYRNLPATPRKPRPAPGQIHYALYREHGARIGRFHMADPVPAQLNLGPQFLNRYAYVGNDPIDLMDPQGQTVVLVGICYPSAPPLFDSSFRDLIFDDPFFFDLLGCPAFLLVDGGLVSSLSYRPLLRAVVAPWIVAPARPTVLTTRSSADRPKRENEVRTTSVTTASSRRSSASTLPIICFPTASGCAYKRKTRRIAA